jgi:polyhydroxyalkanoate synthesis regulator protein
MARAYDASMPKLITRYARHRLHDTQALRYVTVTELRAWAAEGIQYVVIDAETGDDITRILLA